MKKEYQYRYEAFDECNIPKQFYLIVGDYLFYINDNDVDESWPLHGNTLNQKIKDARKQAELENRTRIYVDEDNLFNVDEVLDSGILVQEEEDFDEEELEGWTDRTEYYMNH